MVSWRWGYEMRKGDGIYMSRYLLMQMVTSDADVVLFDVSEQRTIRGALKQQASISLILQGLSCIAYRCSTPVN
jgi:hypothetical protein